MAVPRNTAQENKLRNPNEGQTAMMVDIETLSTRSNAFMLQVGCCVINLRSGDFITSPESWTVVDARKDAHVDTSTARFWMEQDQLVRASVLSAQTFSAEHVAKMLSNHYGQMAGYGGGKPQWGGVWALGGQFDFPILRNFLEGHGQKCPWHFREERDLRTLASVFDPDKRLRPIENALKHAAAEDVKWQSYYLLNIKQLFNSMQCEAAL